MTYTLLQGDCIETMRGLPAGSVQCCVTSPPYFGLRDYGHEGQIGLEETPDAYVAKLVDVFREVRRLLRDDGTCWINLGDSYNGSGGAGGDYVVGGLKEGQPKYPGRRVDGLKPKDLIGIPWAVAFALRADGWYLRSEIIWHKRAPMPESVTDRPTKAHEQVFLLSKSATYYYDADAIREQHKRTWDETNGKGIYAGKGEPRDHVVMPHPNGANRRSVWTLGPESYSGAHFATMPTKLVEPCILAGSRVGDTVLDPFNGSGTTGAVALKHGRKYIGCELNPDYIELAHERIRRSQPMLLEVPA